MAANSNSTKILGVKVTGVTGTATSNLVYSASPTFTGTVTLPAGQVVNGVTLQSAGSATLFLNQAGNYVVNASAFVSSVVDGSGFDFSVSSGALSLTTQLTAGSVPFIGSLGALLQDNANYFYDSTNKRLGLGTNTPATTIHTIGNSVDSSLSARFENTSSAVTSGGAKYGIIDQQGTNGNGITNWANAFIIEGGADGGTVIGAYKGKIVFQVNTRGTQALIISNTGALTASSLAGSGTRMVVADATGNVSTQAINTGTVTGISVVNANGFNGSSGGGATPALTLSTTVTGMLKGNGTAISAATVGTDYSGGTSALATGILKSTTTTGALTIAVANTDYITPSITTLSSLASIGTITTGVWNASVIGTAFGGNPSGGTTGQVLTKNSNTSYDYSWTTISGGGGMVNPMTTTGDIIYSSSGSTPARRGIGSTNQALTVSGGVPTWSSIVNSVSGTTNQVNVSGATGTVTFSLPQDIHTAAGPQFARLGIGAASATYVGMLFTPTLTGAVYGQGIFVNPTLTMGVGGSYSGLIVQGTNLTRAASGTHTLVGIDASLSSPAGTGATISSAYAIKASEPVISGATTYAFLGSGKSQLSTLETNLIYYTETPLTDAATVNWPAGTFAYATVTLGGNRTLAFSSTPKAGAQYIFKIKQDATGGRTLALPSGSKVINGGGGGITLSTAANAVDILTMFYDGTNYFWNYGLNYN